MSASRSGGPSGHGWLDRTEVGRQTPDWFRAPSAISRSGNTRLSHVPHTLFLFTQLPSVQMFFSLLFRISRQDFFSPHTPTFTQQFFLTEIENSCLVAYLYPGYASYKTLSQRPANEEEIERWLMYWSVIGCVVAIESAEWLVNWSVRHLKHISHTVPVIDPSPIDRSVTCPCPDIVHSAGYHCTILSKRSSFFTSFYPRPKAHRTSTHTISNPSSTHTNPKSTPLSPL